MAYIICEPCIGTKDTACVDVCPVDCIHPRKDESDMTRRRRNFKFAWKSKKANHGRKGARGKLKRWGKKN